jgi:hypothetical protein
MTSKLLDKYFASVTSPEMVRCVAAHAWGRAEQRVSVGGRAREEEGDETALLENSRHSYEWQASVQPVSDDDEEGDETALLENSQHSYEWQASAQPASSDICVPGRKRYGDE